MRPAAELRLQRANTAEFIRWNPSVLSLTPQSRTRTATGGFKTVSGLPREPQRFRIIDTSSATMPSMPPQRTIDGEERSTQFFLLGEWDCEMAQYDTWADDYGRWEITQLLPDNGYERRGVVVGHAS